ncbi:centrosomal protein of 164 kDa isoform X2 [Danio rerio]|uniref:Centrosomal protein of 164 kDa isoform X2 n=1 Tax=Danio rerio TaxID=7955 RepID=A0AC58HE45_DANRE
MATTGLRIGDQLVLEEDYDESYIPSEQEIHEYALEIGIDPQREPELLWLAREGMVAPLPAEWKPCQDVTGEVYYFNFSTGQSTWDHPCDEQYRQLVLQERERTHTHAGRAAPSTNVCSSSGAPQKKKKKKKEEKKEKRDKKKEKKREAEGARAAGVLAPLAPLRGLSDSAVAPLRAPLGLSSGLQPIRAAIGAPVLSAAAVRSVQDEEEEDISEEERPQDSAGLLKNLHLDLDALGAGLQYEDSEISGTVPPEERTEPELQDLALSRDHSAEPPSEESEIGEEAAASLSSSDQVQAGFRSKLSENVFDLLDLSPAVEVEGEADVDSCVDGSDSAGRRLLDNVTSAHTLQSRSQTSTPAEHTDHEEEEEKRREEEEEREMKRKEERRREEEEERERKRKEERRREEEEEREMKRKEERRREEEEERERKRRIEEEIEMKKREEEKRQEEEEKEMKRQEEVKRRREEEEQEVKSKEEEERKRRREAQEELEKYKHEEKKRREEEEEEEEWRMKEESAEQLRILKEQILKRRRDEEERMNNDTHTQLQQLRIENELKLQELRSELEAERQRVETQRRRDLMRLREESEEELHEERRRLQEQKEEQLRTIRLQAAVSDVQKDIRSPRPEQPLAEYQRELTDVLQEVRQEVEREHWRKLEQLKEEHQHELQNLRDTHLEKESRERERLLNSLQEERDALINKHTTQLHKLQNTLDTQLEDMRRTHSQKEAELQEWKEELERRSRELQTQEAELQTKAADLRRRRKQLCEEEEEVQSLPALLQQCVSLREDLERARAELHTERQERERQRLETHTLMEERQRLEERVSALQQGSSVLHHQGAAAVQQQQSSRTEAQMRMEDLEEPVEQPADASDTSIDHVRQYMWNESVSLLRARQFLERQTVYMTDRQAALRAAHSTLQDPTPSSSTQQHHQSLQQEVRDLAELRENLQKGETLLREKQEKLNQLETSLTEEVSCDDGERSADRKVTFDVTESEMSSVYSPEGTVPVKVQQLADSLQLISGQLNSVLGALSSVTHKQAPPPLTTPLLPRPSWAWPTHPSSALSNGLAHRPTESMQNRWSGLSTETSRTHTTFSGYTPLSLSSLRPPEVEGQRLQGLIEGNKRWLEAQRKNHNIPLFPKLRSASGSGGSGFIQLSLDDNNQIKVHHF